MRPTLSNLHGIRVETGGRPDTPGELIRHSHAILFVEGYTFVRIGHVRVGSDDFMISIILRRRHRRLRRVFLISTTRSFPPVLVR